MSTSQLSVLNNDRIHNHIIYHDNLGADPFQYHDISWLEEDNMILDDPRGSYFFAKYDGNGMINDKFSVQILFHKD